MAEMRRRPNESFESFMRRAKKRWQASGKLLQVKKVQYFEVEKSRNMRRRSAVRRKQVTDKTEYLRKVGRLPEEDRFPDKKW